jgi:hypothetical protein
MIRIPACFLSRNPKRAIVAGALAAALLCAWLPASSEGPARAAQGENENALAAKMKEMAKPPTEAQLGAPLYPGAFYDARNSAGMSMSGSTTYLFLTADPPAKVADFYAKSTHKQPSEYVKGSYMIALKGKPPFPESGIAIQPNKPGGFDPKYKTIITFMTQSSKDH